MRVSYRHILEAIAAQPGSHTTQRAMTTGSYRTAAQLLQPLLTDDARVLDYGAGLGHGTRALKDVLGSTVTVDSYEPTPRQYTPTFTNASAVTGPYDAVVCLNVLNVLEPTLRTRVTRHLFTVLAPHGIAIIGTRSWSGDVNQTKRGTPADEPHALWVTVNVGGTNHQVYQRGFDFEELVQHLTPFIPRTHTIQRLARVAATGVMVRPRTT